MSALSSDTLHTLGLLNHLAAVGYLDSGLSNAQGGRWRQALVSALKTLFDRLTKSGLRNEDDRRLFGQLSLLLQALPNEAHYFAPLIVRQIVEVVHSASSKSVEELKVQWHTAGPWHDSHLLGNMLSCINHLVKSSTETLDVDELSSQGVLQSILARWAWNREVVGSVAGLMECLPAAMR